MKKIVISSILLITSLLADTVMVSPYIGGIKYDNALSKSLKNKATVGGLDITTGSEDYLLQASYRYSNTSYKDSLKLTDLVQNDFSLIYNTYNKSYMLKVGAHYISNNESVAYKDLGSGIVGIVGISGFNWFKKDKLTYGIDAYYSIYLSGHDDTTNITTQVVDIMQFTPHISYSNVMSNTTRNDIELRINLIAATLYKDKGYISYEFSDTFVYKSFFTTLKYIGGEMKSGVVDGGLRVFNTKDLYTNTLSAKVGYYILPTLAVDASYGFFNYQEYDAKNLLLLPSGLNTVGYISISSKF